jgi:pimeloyl-ACP methyl ester carboxylesterase
MAEMGMPKTVLANGTELHYIEQGSGEPVIFVHGSLGDYRTWMPQVESFAQKYRVISYSRRYHYPNAWKGDGTDYTVSLHADDLIGLIEGLHLGRVNVVGNSFGAYTTLVAETRRPDLMCKLVIGEPPILPWLNEIPGGLPYRDDFMVNAWDPAKRAFQNGNLEEGVRLFIDGVSGQKGIFDRVPAAVKRIMIDNAHSLAAETASPGYYLIQVSPEQIEKISAPLLLLRGANSPKMFHLIMDQLAQCAPNGRQVTIPNASHSMPSNNPPVYNQVVMDFLG